MISLAESRPDHFTGSWRLGAMLLGMLLFSVSGFARPFYVNYSRNFNPTVLDPYDLSILSPETTISLTNATRKGHQSLGYLSIVEIAPDASYRAEAARKKVPFVGKNAEWNSDLVDITSPAWEDFVTQDLARTIVQKGFSGFFLDTVESVEILAQRSPARAAEFRAALIKVIKALKAAYPDKKIVLNRGFQVWESLKAEATGVLIESVLQTYDSKTKKYAPMDAAGTQYLLDQAVRIRQAGLEVFVLDYADPGNPGEARKRLETLDKPGYWTLLSTPELDGKILGPLVETPRHILALFGNKEENIQDQIRWPVDSVIAQTVNMPLEWLGFELDYLNVQLQPLPSQLDPKYAAVVLDRFVRFPVEQEERTLEWLIARKREGRKIIFMGSVPFSESELLPKFLREFGLSGTGLITRNGRSISVAKTSPQMNFETRVNLLTNLLVDLQAPTGSEVLFSVQDQSNPAAPKRFDAVFIAPWGGMMLDPYTFFRRPDFVELWLVDPFYFLDRATGDPRWPRPDATTRDGLRIFFTHIDGDGISAVSSVEPPKRSGQVVLERVIKKYPYPFTCSVITAEIEAKVVKQKPEDRGPLLDLARQIFALPKVEVASHSYTHPFFWMTLDRDVLQYEAQKLELRPEFDPGPINPKKEVDESISFIQEQLCPPGKKVELFLWSGNCRPPPDAIQAVRAWNIENMNGGETTISRKYPTLTKVSAKCMSWGDELQVYTAQQNENVYRERWQPTAAYRSPFYGGFAHAVETFERTEQPRRIKPVNIYYHYYSADNLASLSGLLRLYDWSLTQPLHSLTASQFAKLVRDVRATRVFESGAGQWTIVNDGLARTLLLPLTNSFPNLALSTGITGYNEGPHGFYIHTDGRPRVVLQLADRPTNHLYLISSSAEISFDRLGRDSAQFKVRDERDCLVRLGGLKPGADCQIRINDTSETTKANARGELELKLPMQASVTLKQG